MSPLLLALLLALSFGFFCGVSSSDASEALAEDRNVVASESLLWVLVLDAGTVFVGNGGMYSSLMRSTRLRLLALAWVPFVFLGAGFLAVRVADFLRDVLGLDAAEGTEKWEAVPDALAFSRILAMRSETARGVGRSTPAAYVIPLVWR